MTYNRVEGLVVGLAAVFETRRGFGLELQGAYATATKKFRHLEELRIPLPGRARLELGYAHHVVPYGSNRPTLNWLRALVGSADEQDYLESEGGWVAARTPWGRFGHARLGYEASKESSIDAHTDFAFFGDSRLMATNDPIDDGYDRAVFVRGVLGSLSETGNELDLGYRIAGGGLGGDFTYTRTDIRASVRRYLVASHEVVLDVGFARAGGSPPVQRVADVGGLSTVRGFSRRTLLGKTSLNARLELMVPYDFLAWTRVPVVRDFRLQLVPWGDAGRAWDGTTDVWLTSLGAGLQRYIGPFGSAAFMRLDAAFPTGPHRPETVRWYLHFSRALF
jgi:outer membrane translocation and assembly module TamA